MQKKVIVLGMGGTIAGRSALALDNVGYRAGELGVRNLLEALPAASRWGPVDTEQVAQLNSKDMSFAALTALAERIAYFVDRSDVQGVVVTHGTDTLEEAAFFLDLVCAAHKPVVLTCAMRPATALASDGPQNLMDALAVAWDVQASGVLVVCAGRVHDARGVQKIHPYQSDAFSSGEAGPVALVEEGRVRSLRPWPGRPAAENTVTETIAALKQLKAWPLVDIVMNYVGASGWVVDALVERGVQGLVVAGTGNGTVHHELEAALQRAHDMGVAVLRASRCSNGRVIPTSADVFEDSDGLSPAKARIAMVLNLALAPSRPVRMPG